MFLKTRHFGELEISKDKIIRFEQGLPGFDNTRQFVILDMEEGPKIPFKWLQCVDDPMLAFVIANPFPLKPDYDIKLNNEITEYLEIEEIRDVAIYVIVVIPEDIKKMTMNLKAPLIINIRKGKGMQAILDNEKYKVRHYIVPMDNDEVKSTVGNKTAGMGV